MTSHSARHRVPFRYQPLISRSEPESFIYGALRALYDQEYDAMEEEVRQGRALLYAPLVAVLQFSNVRAMPHLVKLQVFTELEELHSLVTT